MAKQLAAVGEGQMLKVRFAFTQEFFTVFEQNATHLGKLEADLSRRIIKIYTLLRALIENLRINNGILDQLDAMEAESRAGNMSAASEPGSARRMVRTMVNTMQMVTEKGKLEQWGVCHVCLLKGSEAQLKKEVNEFVAILDEKKIK